METMKKAISVMIAAALLLTTATGTDAATPDQVIDRETVYTLLNSDGSVKKTIVVDYLQVEGNGNITVTDFGRLTQLKNISGLEKPVVQNGRITWNTEVKGERSIYYSGETDRQLPVDVAITYYLNGQKVKASSLAGKSGTVKIKVNMKNRQKQKEKISFTGYGGVDRAVEKELVTPMLSLVSVDIPTDHFTDIKTGDAMTVISGKTLNATWMVVPNPEETVTLEMKGMDIELEPITMTLIPMLLPVPEVALTAQLEKLTEGVQQISSALHPLENGANQLAAGNRRIKDGLSPISQGLGQLIQANQAQTGLVKQMLDTNRQSLAFAQKLAAEHPQDASAQALVQALQGQQQMLTTLAQGGTSQGQPFPGLNQIEEGLNGSKTGVEQLAVAAGQLEKGSLDLGAGMAKLSGGAEEMRNELVAGLNKLYAEEAVLNASKKAAARYDTFLGKPQGAKGEVRFILKTDPIKPAPAKAVAKHKPDTDSEKTNRSFFEKIIKFFSDRF